MLQAEKFSLVMPSVCFLELFCLVGEQIVFKILVFGPAGPDIEPGQCTFLSILVF